MGLRIIDHYIGRIVLFMIFICSLVLTTIGTIITFVDQIRHLGDGDIDFWFLLSYVALRIPEMFVMLFPFAVLLGGVIGLGLLAKNSELLVIQSSGLSKTQIILSACKMVFPLIIIVSLFGQMVVPEIKQYAENRYNYAESSGRVSVTSWGFWLRDDNDFISVRRVMSDNSIHGISRFEFEGMDLKRVSYAAMGVYNSEDQKWDMFNVTTTEYSDKEVVESKSTMEKWQLYLNPERMEIFSFKSSSLSVQELMDYIKYLEDNSIDSGRYRIELYKKFVMPFSMVVMLFLGASMVFGSMRAVPMSARVLVGLVLGFGFYLSNEVLSNFTYIVGLPPFLGVILPTVVFLIVTLSLLNRKV